MPAGMALVAAAGCGGSGSRATGGGRTGTGDAVAAAVVVTDADNGCRMCLPLHGSVRVPLPGAAAGGQAATEQHAGHKREMTLIRRTS
ncbi:hypothetical protein [Streptomyces sp. NPDC051109]|uniref:hypothetical protein n=1 Tax=Streptomyces sp. NPDC051109 TaxID=3365642 RepID=UPI0037B5A089